MVDQGEQVSIITFGAGVHWAMEAVKNLKLSADILDLRTLVPLDEDRIFQTVKKTGRVLLLQEDSRFGGVASELAALISEHCFEFLDAPVKRVTAPDMPIPFAKNLEEIYLPKTRLVEALQELCEY